MANELAFILINPYSIAKSRTGGVIARIISRTDAKLLGARMFGPGQELADKYADLIESLATENPRVGRLLADYVRRQYAPDPETGKPRRVMLLLFEGENAIQKIWDVTGSVTNRMVSGSTIRDTYGDYIENDAGDLVYFEPAILVSPSLKRCAATLRLWAGYSAGDGGVIDNATDVAVGDDVQQTLVILKPDNFRFPSLRPGSIIDVLSTSGLRIVAVKKFAMTVAQAERFYGPVQHDLRNRFAEIGTPRAVETLSQAFGFRVPEGPVRSMCDALGPAFASAQFENIVKFMTGHKPSECAEGERAPKCSEECLALVYEGRNAVSIIRKILGPTDPSKARSGTVRREFGTDIMVNAAHASDSPENATREMQIINMKEDTISALVEAHYGK